MLEKIILVANEIFPCAASLYFPAPCQVERWLPSLWWVSSHEKCNTTPGSPLLLTQGPVINWLLLNYHTPQRSTGATKRTRLLIAPMDSNLFFQLVACTLSQNLFTVSLEPIFTCAPLLTEALLDLGFVPPGSCYSLYLGESCFITSLPVRRDICLGISPRILSDVPCHHIWHLYIPASRSWPDTAWPWSPFPAGFYKAIYLQ